MNRFSVSQKGFPRAGLDRKDQIEGIGVEALAPHPSVEAEGVKEELAFGVSGDEGVPGMRILDRNLLERLAGICEGTQFDVGVGELGAEEDGAVESMNKDASVEAFEKGEILGEVEEGGEGFVGFFNRRKGGNGSL